LLQKILSQPGFEFPVYPGRADILRCYSL